MSYPHSTAPKQERALRLVTLLVGLVLLVVLFGRLASVVEKVTSGAGMEHCCMIEGVPFNYLAIFVLLCGVAAVFLLIMVLYVHDWVLRRDFERKYEVKLPASTGEPANLGSNNFEPSMHGYQHYDDY